MFENLGKTLMLLREIHGLNQAQFARLAGLGKSQLSKYETRGDLPRLAVLERMLRTLGLSLTDFAQTLEYVDSLGDKQSLKPPTVVPSTSSTLLGSNVQEAFERVLRELLALQREVVTGFLEQATHKRTTRGKATQSEPSGQQGEGDSR
jgi:transcriptional regulator with XRE-family HTH domain